MRKKVLLPIFTILLAAGQIIAQTTCDTLWTKNLGAEGVDYFSSVCSTDDGGYILAGLLIPPESNYGDFYVVKTNVDGDLLWTRTYGGELDEEPRCIKQTNDGGYIISGKTKSFGAGNSDVYLVRIDGDGDTLWTRAYGGNSIEYGYSVCQTDDDGFVVVGYTDSYGIGIDIYVIKTNAYGDTLWTITYGGEYQDVAYSMDKTSDGNYIIAGSHETVKNGNLDFDINLIKIDNEGNVLWSKTYGGNHDEIAESIRETSDGGFIVTGLTSVGGGTDVYLLKTDANGNTTWVQTWGGTGDEVAYSAKETFDGGFIVTGDTESYGSSEISSLYIIRTDDEGNTLYTQTYLKGLMAKGMSLDICDDDTYIIAGYFMDEDFNFDGWLSNVHDVITGIATSSIAGNLTISPNPATDVFSISLNSIENGLIELTIFDSRGWIVTEKKFIDETYLDVSTFEPGIYYIKMKMDNVIETRKLVIK